MRFLFLAVVVMSTCGCAHSKVGRRGGPAGIFHEVGKAFERASRSWDEESSESQGYGANAYDPSYYPPYVSAHEPVEVSGRADNKSSPSPSSSSSSSSSSSPSPSLNPAQSFDRTSAKRQLDAIDLNSCARRAALPKGYVRVSIRLLGVTGGPGSIDIVEPTGVGDGARHCVEDLLKDMKVPPFNRDDIAITHTWYVVENEAAQRSR
jgi:hypothetical protein